MSKLLPVLVAMLALARGAGANEINWWTFTGGVGIAQHGGIALGGAIGPIAPALSPATGGNYTLTGGFWGALPGQPKAAQPILSIQLLQNGEKVQLSWPINAPGFTLEYTDELGSGMWDPEPTPVTLTATDHTVTVSPTGRRCYRLRSL